MSTEKYEQNFLVKLGEKASADTILAMLRETPVLKLIAETICTEASSLSSELREAKEAEKQAELERAHEEFELQKKRGPASPKKRWADIKAGRDPWSLATAGLQAAGRPLTDAEKKNEEAKKSGAFTLSY